MQTIVDPLQWILSNDTGTSSKTIWAVMMHAQCADPGYPHDADDFGRCYRLLQHFQGWRARLPEVATRYPMWTPLVAAWDELTAFYEQKNYRALYDRIDAMRDEIHRLDGWTKTGPNSWVREGGGSTVRLGAGVTSSFGPRGK